LWVRCESYHHDLDEKGRIFALKADFEVVSLQSRRQRVLVDFVEILDADGKTSKMISLPTAAATGPHDSLLGRISRSDVFHTNTISVLSGPGTRDSGPFRTGNLLVSMRNIDAIATLDADAGSIRWALTGSFRAPHEPSLLESGRILLFDNLGRDGRSRIVEIDPSTGETGWTYPGDGGDLYSSICGTTQRLANGNTLITESTAGRAIEVTPDGEVVWEFRSPHRVDRQGEVLVAILGDTTRIPAEEVDGWLEAPPPDEASAPATPSR
jgi:hypothetical protein